LQLRTTVLRNESWCCALLHHEVSMSTRPTLPTRLSTSFRSKIYFDVRTQRLRFAKAAIAMCERCAAERSTEADREGGGISNAGLDFCPISTLEKSMSLEAIRHEVYTDYIVKLCTGGECRGWSFGLFGAGALRPPSASGSQLGVCQCATKSRWVQRTCLDFLMPAGLNDVCAWTFSRILRCTHGFSVQGNLVPRDHFKKEPIGIARIESR